MPMYKHTYLKKVTNGETYIKTLALKKLLANLAIADQFVKVLSATFCLP